MVPIEDLDAGWGRGSIRCAKILCWCMLVLLCMIALLCGDRLIISKFILLNVSRFEAAEARKFSSRSRAGKENFRAIIYNRIVDSFHRRVLINCISCII